MDRMTQWNGKKWVLPQGRGSWRKIADRLAAYEDTGLDPDEINLVIKYAMVQKYKGGLGNER